MLSNNVVKQLHSQFLANYISSNICQREQFSSNKIVHTQQCLTIIYDRNMKVNTIIRGF